MPIQHLTTITEEWLPVFAYEGVYSVSNRGRIRRDVSRGGLFIANILKGSIFKQTGYRMVKLCTQGVCSHYSIHSLVAQAFLGERPSGYQVNHKDGNRENNDIGNLEYVTPRENVRHGKGTKLTAESVATIRKIFRRGNAKALAKEYGIDVSHLHRIIRCEGWVT